MPTRSLPQSHGLHFMLAPTQVDELYRSGVPAWRSAGWKPSEKHYRRDVHEMHEKRVSGSEDVA